MIPAEAPPAGAVRGDGIQALSHDVLVRRSLEISPGGFITIVSIIQGVALALLAENTFEKPSLLAGVQSIATLLLFVVVFYWYLTMSVLLRWAPSFLDSFLPFAIAGLEIPPAFFLGDARAWNLWLALFWFGTMTGMMITKKWSPQSHFGEHVEAHRVLHRLLRELQTMTGITALGVGLCGLFAFLDWTNQLFWGLSGAIIVLFTVGIIVARTEVCSSQIHAHFGVNRPPFN
ncbi:hypothetical protein Aab01nite_76350 [Paractinoplanes abujensis]|uniref:Uncharacterized protein n=1 Tax=Paractinoplanes abujensis TaxID=882441 RepID=A0A7W7CQC3_9ACTN|nr:hypothetical protein [Actinoplanes abujensis]MBB4692479.1 hypothetical protein [Actinoplanes abujensis]GID24045.1 hypothetical protein Aab01nite_76350 [Actinoplanes abujensis]